jgi:hypothetical protein
MLYHLVYSTAMTIVANSNSTHQWYELTKLFSKTLEFYALDNIIKNYNPTKKRHLFASDLTLEQIAKRQKQLENDFHYFLETAFKLHQKGEYKDPWESLPSQKGHPNAK